MESILLTIAIPTYNRVHLLRQTVELLLPQLREGVELLVCDNASPDGTADYLKSLQPKVRHHRHPVNIGSDPNFLSCISLSRGQYTWILCDDDLPCSNAVEKILSAREEFKEPGLIYLRVKSSDERVTDYSAAPVASGWAAKNRNEFLSDIGVWVTFGSSIVVRRDCVDEPFLKRQCGTNLLSASIALQSAGSTNSIVISERPLLFVRGGNAGGYDAYTVFTKNFKNLLRTCRQFDYSPEALETAYARSLTDVMPYVTQVWPVNARGLFNFFYHSWKYRTLYRLLLPRIIRKLLKSLRSFPARMFRNFARSLFIFLAARLSEEFYTVTNQVLDDAAGKNFRSCVTNLGTGSSVPHRFHLKNPKYFQIGDNFCAGPGLRLEAWDEYAGEHFSPLIKIGNKVGMGWNVHIGAIHRIEIADNVLIGSHVLITDHAHGDRSPKDMVLHPVDRPLRTKGPVIIEEDVWIGEGACILPGVRIGRGAIIGANAVVTSDVPAHSVAGGVPARVLGPVSAMDATVRNVKA